LTRLLVLTQESIGATELVVGLSEVGLKADASSSSLMAASGWWERIHSFPSW